MVFAVLNYGNYRSMCFNASGRAEMAEETEDLPCVEACDSLAVEPVVTPEEVTVVEEEQKIETHLFSEPQHLLKPQVTLVGG